MINRDGENILKKLRTEKVKPGEVIVHWFGLASFALNFPDTGFLYTDPYFSDTLSKTHGWSRVFPAPFDVEELEPAIVLISHNHLDHCDPETICRMQNFEHTIFICTDDCVNNIKKAGVNGNQIQSVKVGQKLSVKGLEIIITPARHLPPRGPKPEAIGAIIKGDGCSVYFSGDTIYENTIVDALKATGENIDIALLPINGRGGNMPAPDAAHMAEAIGASYIIPMHYGLIFENSGNPYEMAYWIKKWGFKVKPVITPVGGSEKFISK
jgi:L-ascorbate metabolism protein UlaG (beta-lactamase superfamily)